MQLNWPDSVHESVIIIKLKALVYGREGGGWQSTPTQFSSVLGQTSIPPCETWMEYVSWQNNTFDSLLAWLVVSFHSSMHGQDRWLEFGGGILCNLWSCTAKNCKEQGEGRAINTHPSFLKWPCNSNKKSWKFGSFRNSPNWCTFFKKKGGAAQKTKPHKPNNCIADAVQFSSKWPSYHPLRILLVVLCRPHGHPFYSRAFLDFSNHIISPDGCLHQDCVYLLQRTRRKWRWGRHPDNNHWGKSLTLKTEWHTQGHAQCRGQE